MNHMQTLVVVINGVHDVYEGWFQALSCQYDLHIITQGPEEKTTAEKNYQVHELPRQSLIDNAIQAMNLPFFQIRLSGLEDKLDELNPDIIMSKIYHQPYTRTTHRYAEEADTPLILFDEQKRDPLSPLANIIFQAAKPFLVNRYGGTPMIGVTPDAREYLDQLGFNTSYIPVSFHSEPKESQGAEDYSLVLISRLIDTKDVVTAVDAMQHLPSDATLDIYGDGPLQSKLEDKAEHISVDDKVCFKGRVDNEALLNRLPTYDMLVHPASFDPIGFVVLEAMANSLPVVVSRGAGSSGYVEDGENGFVVEPGEPEQLAQAVKQAKETGLKTMAERSKELIETEHSVEKSKERLKAVIRRAQQ